MAHGRWQLAAAAGRRRAGIVATALTLGIAGWAGGLEAQQPAPAKKGPAAPAAAPKKDAKDAKGAPPAGTQSAWVKLCEKATAVGRDKEGKEQKKDLNICLTHHERIDANTGAAVVSAALRQVEGQDKQVFMVMVPLGALLKAGMRGAIYPKAEWEKLQKNEKIDETKLKQIKLDYTLCHPGGCTADMEATPELINDLKTSGGLVVFAVNAAGVPTGFAVPLNGFEASYTGAPVDSQKYGEARKALMQQIAQRQHELAEEHRKQTEAQQQGQGAAPAAAAKAAPAKK